MMPVSQPHNPQMHILDDHIHCVMGDASLLGQLSDNKSPIGVFDSGVGGLSVLRHLQAALPDEQFIYLADTKHVPYGERTSAEIERLTHAAVDWLYRQGCQLVVVACNSASTHSLPSLRERYGDLLPIVGLVPALKPAVKNTQTKTVAVLATNATLNGYLLNQVIDEIATPAGVTVLKFAEPSLVPWVEAGMDERDATHTKLKSILAQAMLQQADHLVLGCTHYPFFKDKIATLAPELHLVDSGAAIARRVRSLLQENTDNRPCLTKQDVHQEKQKISVISARFPKLKPVIFTTGDIPTDKNKIKRLFK